MAQTITKGVKALLAEANKVVTTVSIEEAQALLDSPDHVFVDLRDIRELKRSGKIPGAFSCPRGMLEFWIDPDSPYHKEIFAIEGELVLFCASSWRSALAAKTLQDMGFINIRDMDGGFTAWKTASLPTTKDD